MRNADLDSVPDPAAAADLAELIRELGRLRTRAGGPPYRLLAKAVGQHMKPPRTVSYRTVAHMFQPDRHRLDLDLVVAVVRALGQPEAEVARWRDACVRVHAEAKFAEPVNGSRQLPADTRTFIGRDAELERLLRLTPEGGDAVPAPAVVITAIDGMAGVGKSALAVRAAHRLADRFPDGQLFVDLHGFTQGVSPRDPADALASLLASLDVPPGRIPADLEARAAAYRARLAGTRTLILLDNAATEAQVRPLIPAAPGCLVLITSRRRLKALDDAHTVALGLLSQPQAVALLQALAEPAGAAAEDPGWQRVAELCGYLPLALHIAAALLRHRPAWTPGHLADRLRGTLLEPGAFTDGERDLSAVFDLSYQSLADEQCVLVCRLSLSPGPDTDAYAAAALLETDPVRADRLLESLVDQNLLTEPGAGRYRMHDLIRAYAAARGAALESRAEREAALSRLLHYYAHTAQSVSHAITRYPRPAPCAPAPTHMPELRDPDLARAWLRAELPNLDAAFTHAHRHSLDGHTVALGTALAEALYTDGPWSRALEVHRSTADTAQRLGQLAAQATALTELGRVLQLTGDRAAAGNALNRALEIHRALGHGHGEAIALTDLGRLLFQSGDHAEARRALTRSLVLHRENRDRTGEAAALTEFGHLRYQSGENAEAGDDLTRAVEIYQEVGNRSGEAYALTLLGRVLQLTGEHDAARDVHSRALAIHRAIGNRNGEAIALGELGILQHLAGDLTTARNTLTQALELYRAIGNRVGEANGLTDLARLLNQVGDHRPAGDFLRRALEIHGEIGNRTGEAYALTELGCLLRLTADHSGARDTLARAVEIYRELGERGNEAWASNHYAAAIAATGDHEGAFALYRQALAMNRELNKPDDEAISLEGIGEHFLATGDVGRGTAHLREAAEIYQRLDMDVDVARVRLRLAAPGS
jgi:tetratricopeptide (TPR) repeat protein